jgi:hypothetical protein
MRLAPSRMRPRLQAGIGCVTKATWGRPVNARGFIVFYPRIEQPYGALLRRASQDGRVPLESAGSAACPQAIIRARAQVRVAPASQASIFSRLCRAELPRQLLAPVS